MGALLLRVLRRWGLGEFEFGLFFPVCVVCEKKFQIVREKLGILGLLGHMCKGNFLVSHSQVTSHKSQVTRLMVLIFHILLLLSFEFVLLILRPYDIFVFHEYKFEINT